MSRASSRRPGATTSRSGQYDRSMTKATSQFARDTAVEVVPGRPGGYRALVTESWSAPVLPHGGIVTTIALRAMATELALPEQSLRSVTTAFAGQVPPGPVDIDVTLLRRGKTMSQAMATVRSTG